MNNLLNTIISDLNEAKEALILLCKWTIILMPIWIYPVTKKLLTKILNKLRGTY